MKLVDDWKRAHKWLSVHCMIAAGAVQGAWEFVPMSMKASFPAWGLNALTVALLVLGVAGRLVDQSSKDDSKNDDPPKFL